MNDTQNDQHNTESVVVEPAAVVVERSPDVPAAAPAAAPVAPPADPKPADPAPPAGPVPVEADGKLPLTEAMDMLLVSEVLTIERHFDTDLSKLSGTALTSAVAWAHERRRTQGDGKNRPDWAQINAWSMKQLNDYFAPEPEEIDPEDPDTTEGKDDALAG